MKKILNKLKSNSLFTFILGGIVFGSIGIYGINEYNSNSIEYSPTDENWEVSNVNEAINGLYSMKTELDNLKGIGDATAAQILSGKKAVVKGSTVTGTMTNRGAVTNTLNAGGSYTIPAGYHNGSGKVTANSLASQTSATATVADIASDKTAWVNGAKLTGTAITNIDSALTTQTRTVSEAYDKETSYYKSFAKSVTFSFPHKVYGVTGATSTYGHSAIRDISISGNTVSFNLYYGYISSSGGGTNTVTIKAIGY